MGKLHELKKYKFLLIFKGGNHLIIETNTDIRTAKREEINGAIFIRIENQYTINLAQIESIKVKILKQTS
ncbi:hypothetical protein [Psychrobacillus soli]|uniref:Uncharacterized protein n=1 Tax=Psychrobacillus soli TaxID=1543965 RepID=A0A544TLJ3_9BACI|nr:hypothetical protein [Psychrobacillus soli]TQR18280.1 hypothetical protein FG383_02255 [Psychrobacillus soli]